MKTLKDKTMDQNKVGLFISECRKKQNMTQSDLASALHVTDQAVSKWERGLNYPDIGLLSGLADLLRVSVSEILQGERSMSEIKTDEAIKEVLDYSESLIKKEKKLFTKKIMLMRLVIALTVAALLNFYIEETHPRYIASALSSADETAINNHYHGLAFLGNWAYCGNTSGTQRYSLHQSTILGANKEFEGFQIRFPVSSTTDKTARIFCPATIEVNQKDVTTMLNPTSSKGGTLLWSDQDQYPDHTGIPYLYPVVRDAYAQPIIHYWIYDVSDAKDPDTLQLYTRFSAVYDSFKTSGDAVTINGTSAVTKVDAAETNGTKRTVPASYLSAVEYGLVNFMIQVGDSVLVSDVMDVNAHQFEYIYRTKMGEYPFIESRTALNENGSLVYRQIFTSAEGSVTFSYDHQGKALSVDLLHDKTAAYVTPLTNTLALLASNQLELWPVPETLLAQVKALIKSPDPWIINNGVTIVCIEKWESYHITWATLSPTD